MRSIANNAALIRQGGANDWELEGAVSAGGEVLNTAFANCVDLGAFVDMTASPTWNYQQAPYTLTSPFWTSVHLTGTYATSISGMGHEFYGGDEFIEVDQNSSSAAQSTVRYEKSSGSSLFGRVMSFGVDDPAGNVAKFSVLDANSSIPEEKQIATEWVDEMAPPGSVPLGTFSRAFVREVQLAPVDEAFCYLMRVSGDFRRVSDQIRLERKANYWVLSVRTRDRARNESQRFINAGARCYLYNQR